MNFFSLLERDAFYNDNIDKIVKCQAMFRMQKNRRDYRAQQDYWRENTEAVVLVQSMYRGLVARRAYNEKIIRFRNAAAIIIKVNENQKKTKERRILKNLYSASS